MCPANAIQSDKHPADDVAEKRVVLDGLPRLQALVAGPDGDEIMFELQRLLQRDPRRARRFQRDLFARIRVDPQAAPEIAVVRDLSRSGVRLQLSSSAHLDVMQARAISIEMRLPGTPFVNCAATLVRVVEHHKKGIELAFSFLDSGDGGVALDALLEQLAAGWPPASR